MTDSSPRGFHSTLSQNQAPRRFASAGIQKTSLSLRRMGNFIFLPVLALFCVAVPPMSIPLFRPSEYSPGARPTRLAPGLLRAPYYAMETTAFKPHSLAGASPTFDAPNVRNEARHEYLYTVFNVQGLQATEVCDSEPLDAGLPSDRIEFTSGCETLRMPSFHHWPLARQDSQRDLAPPRR